MHQNGIPPQMTNEIINNQRQAQQFNDESSSNPGSDPVILLNILGLNCSKMGKLIDKLEVHSGKFIISNLLFLDLKPLSTY
jgi:hypothetical protein